MIKDTINTAPRWFLTLWIMVTTPLGATAGTLAFNLIMLKIAEIQEANGDATKQAIADTNSRIGKLEVRVAVIESQLPPMVDEIRSDVKLLLKKRSGRGVFVSAVRAHRAISWPLCANCGRKDCLHSPCGAARHHGPATGVRGLRLGRRVCRGVRAGRRWVRRRRGVGWSVVTQPIGGW